MIRKIAGVPTQLKIVVNLNRFKGSVASWQASSIP